MKVILVQDTKKLGKKGDVKEVAEGYARNFLFPKDMAKPATEDGLKKVAEEKNKKEKDNLEALQEIKSLAEKIKNTEIAIRSKQKNGKLFGSIHSSQIVNELGKQGIKISEKNIILSDPIKELGRYEIKIKLGPSVESIVILSVESEV